MFNIGLIFLKISIANYEVIIYFSNQNALKYQA